MIANYQILKIYFSQISSTKLQTHVTLYIIWVLLHSKWNEKLRQQADCQFQTERHEKTA